MKAPQQSMPTAEQFFLKEPIYKTWEINESNFSTVLLIQFGHETLDAFCADCRKPSTFRRTAWLPDVGEVVNHVHHSKYPEDIDDLIENYESCYFPTELDDDLYEGRGYPRGVKFGEFTPYKYAVSNRTFPCRFRCSRDDRHELRFFFRVDAQTITKIGQFPSLADLESHDFGKYRKVLGNERVAEFKRAVGLAAHGVGIGAFVYLRRTLEFLLDSAKTQTASQDPLWDEEKYRNSRVQEKIKLVAPNLPTLLLETKQIYGVLSKGLHALEEQECLSYFETAKLIIELILDEQILQLEKERKIASAKSALDKIKSTGE